MPTSLPSDLPSALQPILHPASPNLANISNVVVFLPGLGDTSANFSSFPRALNLPSTLTLTLQAPIPIPLPDAGTHWGDDLILDTSTGTMDAHGATFNTSTKLLAEDVITNTLIKKCNFKPREILLFGYGQGASVALGTLSTLRCQTSSSVASYNWWIAPRVAFKRQSTKEPYACAPPRRKKGNARP